MNNKTLYLEDPKRLEKVRPIMERRGISPDGWINPRNGEFISIALYQYNIHIGEWDFHNKEMWDETYRADKLEMALPEWCFDNMQRIGGVSIDLMMKLEKTPGEQAFVLKKKADSLRGKEKLEALADLLIL